VRTTKVLARPTCSGRPGMVRDPSTVARECPAVPLARLPRASAGLEPPDLRSDQGRGYRELSAGVFISSASPLSPRSSPSTQLGIEHANWSMIPVSSSPYLGVSAENTNEGLCLAVHRCLQNCPNLYPSNWPPWPGVKPDDEADST
jgi:hypothetical protein